MEQHKIVSREEWLEARKQHLANEKAHSRAHDALMAERRALPWVKVDKVYVFETEQGPQTLAELFDGRSQLIVYHFMFGPGWKEGCDGCSFISDHIDGANLHLPHHDVTLIAASRAPLDQLLPFKRRMGWRFNWVSSFGSDFNYDFGVSFTPEQVAAGAVVYNYGPAQHQEEEQHGISVFYKDEGGDVFHTYSSYARGGDILMGAHNFLDLTPKGRNEKSTMDWVRLHDRYEDAAPAARCHADTAAE
ncbi:MAG TPA: thioredoxin family protein [Allosphingosinicella sp.]|nr:thioredoxin family protein [Allosphingosinicella sp.]